MSALIRLAPVLALVLVVSGARAEPSPGDTLGESLKDPMLAPVPRPTRTLATWQDALTLMKARSIELRVALAEVTRAEGQARSALGALLPQLNGTVSATHQFLTKEGIRVTSIDTSVTPPRTLYETFTTPTQDSMQGSANLSLPLVAPTLWYNLRTARVTEEAARYGVSDAKRLLALSVANAIVAVVTAERVAELNRVGLRQALSRQALVTKKNELGAGTGLDVLRARQDVENARASLVTGDETLRQARESLGLAVGVAEPVSVDPHIDLSALEATAEALCKREPNIETRSDVLASRARARAAGRNTSAVYTQFLPSLSAQSALSTTSVDLGSTPRTQWNIQAVLSIPIWDGGVRYGQLGVARAQEAQTEANLEGLRRQATTQARQALRSVSVAEQALKVARAARDLADQGDKLVRTAFETGQGTSLELVTAAAALRQSEITLALREFETTRARILALLATATCDY